MCKNAGKPMDSDTQHVNPAVCQDEENAIMADGILSEQDANTYKILAILNQEHLRDTFGADDTASDLQDDTPEFSQAFMDGMRAMMAERFGTDAAEQLMTLENNQKNNNIIHHQPKDVSKTEKAMSQETARTDSGEVSLGAGRPLKKQFSLIGHYFSTWLRRAAVVFLIALLLLGGYQVTAQAFKLPMVNFQPEIMEEYSRVGTWDEIISTLDMTDYPKTLEHVYVPGVVAEGYEEVERDVTSKFVDIYYEGLNGQQYQYYQNTIGAGTYIDTEYEVGEEIVVNNCPAFLVVRDGGLDLWWIDYQYAYQLVGNLTEEEILSIAESLCELKD